MAGRRGALAEALPAPVTDSLRDGLGPLVVAAVAVQLASLVRVLGTASGGNLPLDKDAAMLQHVGWYVTQGGVPYVDAWDVKPPLTHETTAVLAVVSGGDVVVLHLLSVLTTAAAAVGIVVLVGVLVERLTDDQTAAIVAGLVVLTHPGMHYLPAFGFRSKYFALLAGLVGIYLVTEDRPLWSGVAAAASPAYWQFGLVFPILCLGLAADGGRATGSSDRAGSAPAGEAGTADGPLSGDTAAAEAPVAAVRRGIGAVDRGAVGRLIGGMAATTVVVVAPFVLWGAVPEMLSQVVFAPFVVSESGSVLKHGARAFLFLGYTVPFALLAAWGVATVVRYGLRERWWVLAVAAWFGLQVLVLDFDSYPDLVGALVVGGLGVGLVVPRLSGRQRRAVVVGAVAVTLVSTLWLGSFGLLVRPLGMAENDDVVTRQVMIDVGEAITGRSVTEPPASAGPTRADLGLDSISPYVSSLNASRS